jgi:hypothetical protein
MGLPVSRATASAGDAIRRSPGLSRVPFLPASDEG